MAADIEFNVRNGMTVGASKHSVLDVNGGVSARGLTMVSGQILSGGMDIISVINNQISISESQIVDLQGYVTETYVTDAISDVISGAPEALDTLNELASALNDDASFATNVTNSIATKWTQDDDKITNWDSTYVSVSTNSANWDSAYSWGDHATANYLTNYTVTVHDVTAHEGSIDISESQIVDLQDYLLASDIVSADNWSLAYTTVTANSAEWASHTDITNLNSTVSTNSGNWNDVYTHVQTTSSSWGGAAGYTADIGNGSDTTIDVTHNLNSIYVTYSLIDNNTNEFVTTETSIVDANSIRLKFTTAPTANEFKIVIISTDGTGTTGSGGGGGTSFSLNQVTTSGTISQDTAYTHNLYDCTAGDIVVDLANPADHVGVVQHKRIDGSANTVTLSSSTGATIDGLSEYLFDTQYEAIGLYTDGTNYFIQ